MNYYARYVRTILRKGHEAKPRGMPVRFLMNQTFAYQSGEVFRRMKDNPMIGFMEGLQFIAGVFDLDQIARVAPKARLGLFGTNSAYGLRVGEQAEQVVELLRSDPDTRQAVVILGRPQEHVSERPCTSQLQFIRKHDVITTIVTMRSSDAIWGLPYDVIQFGMFSKFIASAAGGFPGSVVINIGHAHVYDDTSALARECSNWIFDLPIDGKVTVDDWRDWAYDEIHKLTFDHVKDNYGFQEDNRRRNL